jgi:hypothetical protein
MKNKKLSLKELHVQSFVTEAGASQKLMGGSASVDLLCDRSIELPRCMVYDYTARCHTGQFTVCGDTVCNRTLNTLADVDCIV